MVSREETKEATARLKAKTEVEDFFLFVGHKTNKGVINGFTRRNERSKERLKAKTEVEDFFPLVGHKTNQGVINGFTQRYEGSNGAIES